LMVSFCVGISLQTCCGRRGGFPQQINLRRGQGVGLVDEVAEGEL